MITLFRFKVQQSLMFLNMTWQSAWQQLTLLGRGETCQLYCMGRGKFSEMESDCLRAKKYCRYLLKSGTRALLMWNGVIGFPEI